MAYQARKNGVAGYNDHMQLSLTQIQALSAIEGPDALSYEVSAGFAKYAVMTYVVNPTPITISGDIEVDGTIEGYDHINRAQVDSGHNLWVSDSAVLQALVNLQLENEYSRIIQSDLSGNTYIAHAENGTLASDPGWRAQKLDVNGSRSWANSGLFASVATDLSGLIYSY